jgi:hypothetical protein
VQRFDRFLELEELSVHGLFGKGQQLGPDRRGSTGDREAEQGEEKDLDGGVRVGTFHGLEMLLSFEVVAFLTVTCDTIIKRFPERFS